MRIVEVVEIGTFYQNALLLTTKEAVHCCYDIFDIQWCDMLNCWNILIQQMLVKHGMDKNDDVVDDDDGDDIVLRYHWVMADTWLSCLDQVKGVEGKVKRDD